MGQHLSGAIDECDCNACELARLKFEVKQLKSVVRKHVGYVEDLEATLVPFANAAEFMTAGKACDPGELGIWSDDRSGCRVTVADFQRAAKALAPAPETPCGVD